MMNRWSFDGNRIVSHWTDIRCKADQVPERVDAPEMSGSYLVPLPDFASHSPFGGATWFTPHLNWPTQPVNRN